MMDVHVNFTPTPATGLPAVAPVEPRGAHSRARLGSQAVDVTAFGWTPGTPSRRQAGGQQVARLINGEASQ